MVPVSVFAPVRVPVNESVPCTNVLPTGLLPSDAANITVEPTKLPLVMVKASPVQAGADGPDIGTMGDVVRTPEPVTTDPACSNAAHALGSAEPAVTHDPDTFGGGADGGGVPGVVVPQLPVPP